LFGETISVPVSFSNIGNAPLIYSSTGASGILAPNESVTVQVSLSCGWFPGDQDIPFYVNSNDPDAPQKWLIITVHCYGEFLVNSFPIVYGDATMVAFLEGIPRSAFIGTAMSLRFPTISTTGSFPVLISSSYNPTDFPIGDYFIPELSGAVYSSSNSKVQSNLYYSNAHTSQHEIPLSEYEFQHGIVPYDLYNAEVAKLPNEMDNALNLYRSLLINNANQSITIFNIQRDSQSSSDFFRSTTTTLITADVKFSFN
jgi:hypothetical protein